MFDAQINDDLFYGVLRTYYCNTPYQNHGRVFPCTRISQENADLDHLSRVRSDDNQKDGLVCNFISFYPATRSLARMLFVMLMVFGLIND